MLHVVLTIRRSSITELRAEEHGLTEMNWAETHPGIPCAIDWEFYHRAEDAGALDVLSAWEGPRLCGYCVLLRYRHPQSGEPMASSCGLYVRPGRDAGFALRRLVDAAGEIARAAGSASMTCDAGIDSPLGRLLSRIGYRPHSITYERML